MIIFSVGSILGKVGMQNFMDLASWSQISKHPNRVGICSVHGCQEMAVTSPILHDVEGMEKIRINFGCFLPDSYLSFGTFLYSFQVLSRSIGLAKSLIQATIKIQMQCDVVHLFWFQMDSGTFWGARSLSFNSDGEAAHVVEVTVQVNSVTAINIKRILFDVDFTLMSLGWTFQACIMGLYALLRVRM